MIIQAWVGRLCRKGTGWVTQDMVETGCDFQCGLRREVSSCDSHVRRWCDHSASGPWASVYMQPGDDSWDCAT